MANKSVRRGDQSKNRTARRSAPVVEEKKAPVKKTAAKKKD